MTHGQGDARPAVTFPTAEHHRTLTGTKYYTAWWQRHVCEKNLPKVVTWKRSGWDSNPQHFELRAVYALTMYIHHQAKRFIYKALYKCPVYLLIQPRDQISDETSFAAERDVSNV